MCFCCIEGSVRFAEQRVQLAAFGGVGEADAGLTVHRRAVGRDGLGQRVRDALRRFTGCVFVGQPSKQDGELVAAEACRQVVVAEA